MAGKAGSGRRKALENVIEDGIRAVLAGEKGELDGPGYVSALAMATAWWKAKQKLDVPKYGTEFLKPDAEDDD